MKTFTFQIDDIIYSMPTKSFIFSDDGVKCQPGIFYSEALNVSFVGEKFFESFVMTYDYSNGSIKLGKSVNAPFGTTIEKFHPKPEEPESTILPENDD